MEEWKTRADGQNQSLCVSTIHNNTRILAKSRQGERGEHEKLQPRRFELPQNYVGQSNPK